MLGVGTFKNYVALAFYAGYVHVFLEFCKVFESGGIGKNGSTIAVSLLTKWRSPRANIFSYLLPFCTVEMLSV